MQYVQFKFTAVGLDGRNYECTMFYEQQGAPGEADAIADAERRYPGFTGVQVTSTTLISLTEYSFRVRTMCDCDTWGFQLISQ